MFELEDDMHTYNSTGLPIPFTNYQGDRGREEGEDGLGRHGHQEASFKIVEESRAGCTHRRERCYEGMYVSRPRSF